MKRIKPGQIYVHNHTWFRAKKREMGCKGCILDNVFVCPNIKFNNPQREPPCCELNGIIFVKF